MALGCVRTGFPSPAEDFGITRFDLPKSLIRHPSTTFVMPLRGGGMIGAGPMAVIGSWWTSSYSPQHDDIVVAEM